MDNTPINPRSIFFLFVGVALAVLIIRSEPLPPRVVMHESVMLPIQWGSTGKRLVESGVIDYEKFRDLYKARGGLTTDAELMLTGSVQGQIRMTEDNAHQLLNIFWGVGFGNKNPILENGPIANSKNTEVGNFASTGGWTLTRGHNMDHFSAHEFIVLSPEQQSIVERTAKNIYRPCCGNSTYFPDCNHGMAMLGLLELMAANGVSEEKMYEVALAVNSLWFPDSYEIIDKFINQNDLLVSPKQILGAEYSSSKGMKKIEDAIKEKNKSSAGCSV